MEAAGSSETLVMIYQTACHHIPEDGSPRDLSVSENMLYFCFRQIRCTFNRFQLMKSVFLCLKGLRTFPCPPLMTKSVLLCLKGLRTFSCPPLMKALNSGNGKVSASGSLYVPEEFVCMATFMKEIPGQVNVILTKNVTCYSSVAGVILRANVPAFERMLWRMFSWNMCVRVKPLEILLEDPEHVSCYVKSEVLRRLGCDTIKFGA
jgi:hypothetical protein